jgi:hypothetical protein
MAAVVNNLRVVTSSWPTLNTPKMASSGEYIRFCSSSSPSISCFAILLICGLMEVHTQTFGCCLSIRACNNSFCDLRSYTCCSNILTIACELLCMVQLPVSVLPLPGLPVRVLPMRVACTGLLGVPGTVPVAVPVLGVGPAAVLGAASVPAPASNEQPL